MNVLKKIYPYPDVGHWHVAVLIHKYGIENRMSAHITLFELYPHASWFILSSSHLKENSKSDTIMGNKYVFNLSPQIHL